jgi:hypothetical protein
VRDGLGLLVDLVRIAWWLRRDAYIRPGESGLPPAVAPAEGAPGEG